MESESVFLSYVRHIFSKWSGLQAAIDEGMGGPYAREKEAWIGEEVENYFKRYDEVKPEDIEDYLGTMIENEFETYFEDDSLVQISKNLCHAYVLSLTNPHAEMFQDSNKIANARLSQQYHQKMKTDEGSGSSVEEKMHQLSMNEPEADVDMSLADNSFENSEGENVLLNGDIDNDGWTVIGKKGKRTK